jgi:hypothetical protein
MGPEDIVRVFTEDDIRYGAFTLMSVKEAIAKYGNEIRLLFPFDEEWDGETYLSLHMALF